MKTYSLDSHRIVREREKKKKKQDNKTGIAVNVKFYMESKLTGWIHTVGYTG